VALGRSSGTQPLKELMHATAYPLLNRSLLFAAFHKSIITAGWTAVESPGKMGKVCLTLNFKGLGDLSLLWQTFFCVFTPFSQAISGRKLVLCCSILLLLNYLFHDYLQTSFGKMPADGNSQRGRVCAAIICAIL